MLYKSGWLVGHVQLLLPSGRIDYSFKVIAIPDALLSISKLHPERFGVAHSLRLFYSHGHEAIFLKNFQKHLVQPDNCIYICNHVIA